MEIVLAVPGKVRKNLLLSSTLHAYVHVKQIRDVFEPTERSQLYLVQQLWSRVFPQAFPRPQRILIHAQAYQEDQLPRARGDAARVLEASEAFRQERIADATGQAEKFLKVLEEYEKAPDITRQRLYLESMEKILPGVTKYIISETVGGNMLQFLPLDGSTQTITNPQGGE